MKKIIGLTAMVAFLAVAMLAFANPKAPTEDITMHMEGAKKPPVVYSHTKHATVAADCKTCHHKWNGEGNPQKCESCHKAKKEGKKVNLKNAAHKKCRGCHRSLKKAGKKHGPTPCKGCHKK